MRLNRIQQVCATASTTELDLLDGVTALVEANLLWQVETAEGLPLPPDISAQLERAMARLALIKTQIAQLDADLGGDIGQAQEPAACQEKDKKCT